MSERGKICGCDGGVLRAEYIYVCMPEKNGGEYIGWALKRLGDGEIR